MEQKKLTLLELEYLENLLSREILDLRLSNMTLIKYDRLIRLREKIRRKCKEVSECNVL